MLRHCPPWAQASYIFLFAHKTARKGGKKATEVERVRKQDAGSQALGVSEGSLCWGNTSAAKWKPQSRHRTPAGISGGWAFCPLAVPTLESPFPLSAIPPPLQQLPLGAAAFNGQSGFLITLTPPPHYP